MSYFRLLNFNYLFNGSSQTSQTFISPIPGTEGDTFAIATAQETTTTPEPGSVIALLGLGLGFVITKRKKQA